MRLFKNANVDFLGIRRRVYLFSIALLVVGLFSIFFHKGFRYGVDFAGGTVMQLDFNHPVQVSDIRKALGVPGLRGSQIQRFGETQSFLIRLPQFDESGKSSIGERVKGRLDDTFGADSYKVSRTEAVGPKIGSELKEKALIAILLSFALTLIYLAFRFEWRFGVAAIIATAHDILITFGFISLLNVEIDLATVAAILTIVGYSLNDTIVVFDRIRENLKRRKKESYDSILNRSINETLPRTTLTSGTTLLTLFALWFFGGPVIKPFALILILGIGIGTFSSIFVASPALLEIELYSRRKARAATATS